MLPTNGYPVRKLPPRALDTKLEGEELKVTTTYDESGALTKQGLSFTRPRSVMFVEKCDG